MHVHQSRVHLTLIAVALTPALLTSLPLRGAGQLDQAIFSLTAKVMHHESLAAAATEKSLAAAKAEHDLQLLQIQQAADELRTELDQVRCQAAAGLVVAICCRHGRLLLV